MTTDKGIPRWFAVAWWVALVLGLGMTGLIAWLIYSAAMWLLAHS